MKTATDTKLYTACACVAAGLFITGTVYAQQYPNQQPYPPPQQQPYPQQGEYPPQSYPQQYPAQTSTYNGPAPQLYPDQLDNLVGRIALYPDPLLAEVLTAATYPDQIPAAATWAVQHRNLTGPDLANAMQDDQLYFEPNVMALIPFPDVLDMMARDPGWTQQLGSAVLADRGAVMDSVQRMRQRAYDYGYLRSNPYEQVVVAGPGDIEILPVQTGYYYVPRYNPGVVFVRPRPGFAIGAGISFGPRIFIGANFGRFGWLGPGLDWRARTVIIDRHPWERSWGNRDRYVHPYAERPAYVRPPAGYRLVPGMSGTKIIATAAIVAAASEDTTTGMSAGSATIQLGMQSRDMRHLL